MKTDKLYKILLFSLMSFLAIIVIYEQYPSKIYKKISNQKPKRYSYEDNWLYNFEINQYQNYTKKTKIAFLGDSHIDLVNWEEMLERNDILERGIVRDITSGMLHRLPNIIAKEPEICFILGGINDITLGLAPTEINENLNSIFLTLNENKIKPIVFSIIHVSRDYPDHKIINSKVKILNSLLKESCEKHNINFVNINEILSPNHFLLDQYSFDGIHLNSTGYSEWLNIIADFLN